LAAVYHSTTCTSGLAGFLDDNRTYNETRLRWRAHAIAVAAGAIVVDVIALLVDLALQSRRPLPRRCGELVGADAHFGWSVVERSAQYVEKLGRSQQTGGQPGVTTPMLDERTALRHGRPQPTMDVRALRRTGSPPARSPRLRPPQDARTPPAARQLRARSTGAFVLTHGEPHPANTIITTEGLVLIDWDTALLVPPERDLWTVAGNDASVLEAYTAATGRPVIDEVLTCYRLSWDINEIALYVALLRNQHTDTADTAESWRNLQHFLRPEARWPHSL
jgi:hypothetical protein